MIWPPPSVEEVKKSFCACYDYLMLNTKLKIIQTNSLAKWIRMCFKILGNFVPIKNITTTNVFCRFIFYHPCH